MKPVTVEQLIARWPGSNILKLLTDILMATSGLTKPGRVQLDNAQYMHLWAASEPHHPIQLLKGSFGAILAQDDFIRAFTRLTGLSIRIVDSYVEIYPADEE